MQESWEKEALQAKFVGILKELKVEVREKSFRGVTRTLCKGLQKLCKGV